MVLWEAVREADRNRGKLDHELWRTHGGRKPLRDEPVRSSGETESQSRKERGNEERSKELERDKGSGGGFER